MRCLVGCGRELLFDRCVVYTCGGDIGNLCLVVRYGGGDVIGKRKGDVMRDLVVWMC